MYIIEQWNGLCDMDYGSEIVAGWPTLEEAASWCHKQSPTRPWYETQQAIPIEQAFKILHIEGENVNSIPYPWKDQ